MGRFYPRNAQSRDGARQGPDHISGNSPRQQRSKRDDDVNNLYGRASTFALASTGANSVAASSLVAGFNGVVFTLTGADQWAGDVAGSLKINSLIAGLSGSGAAGLQASLNAAAFSLDISMRKLNVKFPATAAYSIGASQSYNWTFPEDFFIFKAGAVTVTSAMVVTFGA
jgi:hypothetical protein